MVWAPRSIELWLAAVLLLQHLDQRGAEAVVDVPAQLQDDDGLRAALVQVLQEQDSG